jgi:hypothetical protein
MGGLIGQLAYDIPKSTRQLVITSTPYIDKVEPTDGYIYLGGERKAYSSLSSFSITLSENAGPLPAGTSIYHLGGRARLNEVEIFSSTQEVEGNEEPIPSNDIVDLIVWIFTKKFNYDQNRIIRPGVTITGPTKIYFTRGNAIEILSELCEDYALRIVEYPDGSLEIISESELSKKNISIFWSNSLIRSIRSTGSPVQRVSQVVLKLRDPVTNDVRTFFYPDDPRSTGSPVEVERTAPLEYGPLLAQIAFYDEAGREGYEITAKGALDYVWGGQVHSLVDGTLSVVSNVYLTEGSELSAAVELEAI